LNRVIESGSIRKQSDMKLYSYQVEILDKSCMEELTLFQESVYKKMADKSIYAPFAAPLMLNNFGLKGITLGLRVQGDIKGFISFHFPGPSQDNFGRDVGLVEEELDKVVHWDHCLIHPDFRGNSMQERMGLLLVKTAADMNRYYRYMFATVSPQNYPSLHQLLLQQNMLVVSMKIKYGNLLRLILFQDILNPLRVEAYSAVSINCGDLPSMADLLERGYYGYNVKQGEKGIEIIFAKGETREMTINDRKESSSFRVKKQSF